MILFLRILNIKIQSDISGIFQPSEWNLMFYVNLSIAIKSDVFYVNEEFLVIDIP